MVHNKTNQLFKLHCIRFHSNFVFESLFWRITIRKKKHQQQHNGINKRREVKKKKQNETKLCSLFSVKLILIRCVSATNTDRVFVMKSHLVLCTICIYNDIINWSSVVNTQYRVIYTAAYESVLTK